ncbi:hypothetical protein K0817_001660 [Microbacterium sp. HD4P20]|uniref:hypothetical protein n=1 Tax=Microbacterium sp. HD4P20 TaxID=2864874 RepID=UPI001C6437F2|nr:hypothetical protein [Microbacterium sp. HD4P20]MCP2635272.1 hypothetical protein [Microbacterium sp. HD4P20]
MAEDSRSSVARRWEIGAAWLGAALAATGVVVAAMTALPPSLENLSSEVSDGVTAVPIGDGAEVVVPADWILTGEGGGNVAVRTPDGVLTARLETVERDAAEIIAETPDVEGAARSELLASGMSATHADLADGGVVAVVAGPEGGDAVLVVVEVGADDAAEYRPAIADLLEGIRA